jgi:hypothetical protein
MIAGFELLVPGISPSSMIIKEAGRWSIAPAPQLLPVPHIDKRIDRHFYW